MSVTFKGKPVQTSGEPPKKGEKAPAFTLVRQNLDEATLETYAGKVKLLTIFPSLDTSVCATAVKQFHQRIANNDSLVVLNISMDLPFAQGRFCTAENLKNIETLSAFRSSFGKDYGLLMTDGPLKGLLSRVVILLDPDNTVLYTEQVSEITQEPDYEQVLQEIIG